MTAPITVLAAWHDGIPWIPIVAVYLVSTTVMIAIMWSGLRIRRKEAQTDVEKP